MSRALRPSLAGFTLQELRAELDKRARALGKPPHQWDQKRTDYLRDRIAETRQALDEVVANGSPRGYQTMVRHARERSLKERLRKYEAWLLLAEADEKQAEEARKRR